MPANQSKSFRTKSSVAPDEVIRTLRQAVNEDSALLLSDLRLAELGIAEKSIRSMLRDRGRRWDARSEPQSELSKLKSILHNKTTGRRFAASQGCRVPELYWSGKASEPPDFSKLPSNFVLKPNESHSAQGVVVCCGGEDLIARRKISLPDLPKMMTSIAPSIGLTSDAIWLVEELIVDVNPQYRIPLDYKLFCAGGRAHLLFCSNRNARHNQWSASWYTRSWQYVYERMNYGFTLGPDFGKPPGFEALLNAADRLAAALGIFVRIDFYLTREGPVLGEFSPFPSHGLKNTEYGERTLGQLWSLFPDPDGL